MQNLQGLDMLSMCGATIISCIIIAKVLYSWSITENEYSLEEKPNIQDFPHQIAGHSGKSNIKACSNIILKPFQDKNRGELEHEFYEYINANKMIDSVCASIHELIPRYLGVTTISDIRYLKLEDLTASFRSPCIMDIKMGTLSYDAGASPEKIAYETSKFPLQQKVGFRIQGFKVFNGVQNVYESYDREYGRSFKSEEEIIDGLALFFRGRQTITKFIPILNRFIKLFSIQTKFKFIASSLLFIYDAESDSNNPLVDLRLIDFAHADINRKSVDTGVLIGLDHLHRYLCALQSRLSNK